MTVALPGSAAEAAIVYSSNVGPNGDYSSGGTVAASYTPTAATNSVLVLAVSADNAFSNTSASFNGTPMTLLGDTAGRTAIFYLPNPGTAAGAITLTTGGNAGVPETISYGTLTGVDTSVAPKASSGVTRSGATLTAATPLPGLAATDYVLAAFFANNATNFNGATGRTYSSPLANLAFTASPTNTADYAGAIGGAVVGADGNYAPAVTFTGGTYTAATAPVVGGTFVAFTAVPEPSSALLAGLAALGTLVRRRRGR